MLSVELNWMLKVVLNWMLKVVLQAGCLVLFVVVLLVWIYYLARDVQIRRLQVAVHVSQIRLLNKIVDKTLKRPIWISNCQDEVSSMVNQLERAENGHFTPVHFQRVIVGLCWCFRLDWFDLLLFQAPRPLSQDGIRAALNRALNYIEAAVRLV